MGNERSRFEDQTIGRPLPDTTWETGVDGVNRIVYVLEVHTELYPMRERVSMGAIQFKGAPSGRLTLSIVGENICRGIR